MGLAQLEMIFRNKRIPLQRENGNALRLDAQNGQAVYPIIFTEEQHGWIQALMWFPAGNCLVSDHAGLFTEIKKRINGVDLGFNAKTGRFWIGAFMQVDTAWRETNNFVFACDVLLPVFVRATEVGKWDRYLVELAFMQTDILPRT